MTCEMIWVSCYIFVLGLAGALAEGNDPGEPLFVTDLLPDRYNEAQAASRVDLSVFGWESKTATHTGFFTLDKRLGKNTFFWYSEALDGNQDAPLLLWLQGGPGSSSLYGAFTEVGAFGVFPGGKLQAQPFTWNRRFHMLYLDSPVGTGFSFTESVSGFVTNMTQVGDDLAIALLQFFQLFPALRKNEFYVTGESYAGKYVPACAFTLHQRNKLLPAKQRINLRGISIGDGVLNPREQFTGFGDLLWTIGMADSTEREQFHKYEAKLRQHIDAGESVAAFMLFDEMLNADIYPYPSYYANVTGMGLNYFNFEAAPDADGDGGDFVPWLNNATVRSLIHVGSSKFVPDSDPVEKYLLADWVRDIEDMLVPVLENYKVLIYNGQNDIILGPAMTEKYLSTLKWSGAKEFHSAKKMIWRLPSKGKDSKRLDVAGYAREAGNFSQVVVRGAGHMVPGDQPKRALDLIERFVAGQSFGANLDEVHHSATAPFEVLMI